MCTPYSVPVQRAGYTPSVYRVQLHGYVVEQCYPCWKEMFSNAKGKYISFTAALTLSMMNYLPDNIYVIAILTEFSNKRSVTHE